MLKDNQISDDFRNLFYVFCSNSVCVCVCLCVCVSVTAGPRLHAGTPWLLNHINVFSNEFLHLYRWVWAISRTECRWTVDSVANQLLSSLSINLRAGGRPMLHFTHTTLAPIRKMIRSNVWLMMLLYNWWRGWEEGQCEHNTVNTKKQPCLQSLGFFACETFFDLMSQNHQWPVFTSNYVSWG